MALFATVLAGCGAGKDAGVNPTDAGGGCRVFITFDPSGANAIAGPMKTERAIGHVDGFAGIPDFHWTVTRAATGATVDFVPAQADMSQIEFPITAAGTYSVELDLFSTQLCPSDVEAINILSGNGDEAYRLRVRAATAPPQETDIAIPRNTPTYDYGGFPLSKGKAIAPTLTHGSTQVPAYVRLAPMTYPDEIVEAYSDATGVFHATIIDHVHTMLVIPALPGIAPQRIDTDFSGQTTFDLATGSSLSGTVKGPSNVALAGAHVQLMIDDLPSTLTTTAADGSFTVQAVTTPGAMITVDVTPPASSGLPRLDATGAFDPSLPFAISYQNNTAPIDLAGVRVMRGAANAANAQVTLVGTIGNVGTVATGATSVTATGAFHATATADGAGLLPTLKTPALSMSAVILVAPGDLAVSQLTLDLGTPSTIQAPAGILATSRVGDVHGAPLAGVTVDAAPTGPLALAGAVPIRLVSDANGMVAVSLASGGQYELRLQDVQSRVAPLVVPMITAANLPATLAMPGATIVSGDVSISGSGATSGALVQVLCKSCGGVDRTRPIAEVTTDASGHYHYVVADPGPP